MGKMTESNKNQLLSTDKKRSARRFDSLPTVANLRMKRGPYAFALPTSARIFSIRRSAS